MKTTHTVERVDGAYELTVNGDFYGRFPSNVGADRFRKLVVASAPINPKGRPLDARTLALIAQARMERAERLNRATAAALVATVTA